MAMAVSVQADLKNFTTEMDRGMKKIDQFGVNSSRATDSVQKMTDSLNKLTGNAIPGLSSIVPHAAAVRTGIEGMLGTFRLFKESDFFRNQRMELLGLQDEIIATEGVQKILNSTTLAYGVAATAGIGAVAALGYGLYKVFEDINAQAEAFEKRIQSIERRMTDLANKSNSLVKEQFTTAENEEAKLAEYDQAINDLQNAMRREHELVQKIGQLQERVDAGPQGQGDYSLTTDREGWLKDKKELEQAQIEFAKLAAGISEMADMDDLVEARSRFQEKIDQRIKDEEEKRIAAEEAAAQKEQELRDKAAADEAKRLADIEKERQRIHDQEMNSYRQLVESLDPAVKTMRELQEAEAMLIEMRKKGLITPEYAQQLWDEALKKASESDRKTEKKSSEKTRESNAAVMAGSTEDYAFRFANKGQDKQLSLLQSSLDVEKKMESSLATIAGNSKNSNIAVSVRGN